MRKNLPLPIGAVVVVAAVALTIVLSGGESDDRKPAAPETSEPRPKPELKPLELGPSVWATEDMWPVRNTGGVQLLDGALLTATSKSIGLVDVATGRLRWTQPDNGELLGGDGAVFDRGNSETPYLVRHQNGLGVVVAYQRGHGDRWEQGLALLSGVDGSVVWRTPTAPIEPCGSNHWRQSLHAADDTTAVVQSGPDFGRPDDPGLMRTIAIDVATGAKKWELAGVWPYGITGDSLITTTEEPLMATPETGTATKNLPTEVAGQVAAVDLRTGAPRWALADRFAASEVVHTAGNTVAVLTPGKPGYQSRLRVFDTATGQEIAELGGSAQLGLCATDGHDMITCASERGERAFVTFSVKDRSVRTGRLEERVVQVTATVDGRISVVAMKGLRFITVDRGGNTIDTKPPGELVATVDSFAIFHSTGADGREHTEVHTIAG